MLPTEEVLPEEEVLAVAEVLAVVEVLAEELVLLLDADPSQGFQELTTQSPLALVEAVLLTAVVVVVVLLPLLDVVAPN